MTSEEIRRSYLELKEYTRRFGNWERMDAFVQLMADNKVKEKHSVEDK